MTCVPMGASMLPLGEGRASHMARVMLGMGFFIFVFQELPSPVFTCCCPRKNYGSGKEPITSKGEASELPLHVFAGGKLAVCWQSSKAAYS